MADEIRNKEYDTTEDSSRRGSEDRELSGTDTGKRHDANRDPLTGAPGSHPVGTGVGAAAGGAAAGAATGAVIGSMAGPIGTAVGTAIGTAVGAVAGGYAGKGIAESINPTEEDTYWRTNYQDRPYVAPGSEYEEYQGAYQYGWESRGRYQDKDWDDVQGDLAAGWAKTKHGAHMSWDKAKHAARDAWDRLSGKGPHHS